MKLHYFSETDTLSIEFREGPSADTVEIAHDVTVDFDSEGRLLALDIDLASGKVDLTRLDVMAWPAGQGNVDQVA